MKHWIAAVFKQKCARMHQILLVFQFPFPPGSPPLGALPPYSRGGREGMREKGGKGEGKGMGEVCVIAVGVIDAPVSTYVQS